MTNKTNYDHKLFLKFSVLFKHVHPHHVIKLCGLTRSASVIVEVFKFMFCNKYLYLHKNALLPPLRVFGLNNRKDSNVSMIWNLKWIVKPYTTSLLLNSGVFESHVRAGSARMMQSCLCVSDFYSLQGNSPLVDVGEEQLLRVSFSFLLLNLFVET